jgi:uncharacterized protein YqjF (DUF2071 family)
MSALDLDRLTPTRPPGGRPLAGHQTWRHLLFAHWSFDAAAVRAVVPPELELDLWAGRAWVGAVPFEMRDIRLAWMPGPLGMNFLEANLRTYVHYKGEPGVYFFSLEASSRLAVQAARWGWGLPYHHARMRVDYDGEAVRYSSVRTRDPSATLTAEYDIGEALGESRPGSLEFFLLERYYLFACHKGAILKGHVHHTPYPARRARVRSMTCGLLAAAGLPARTDPPEVVHYSPGVVVRVFGPWAL